jgi:hypothetical protein
LARQGGNTGSCAQKILGMGPRHAAGEVTRGMDILEPLAYIIIDSSTSPSVFTLKAGACSFV